MDINVNELKFEFKFRDDEMAPALMTLFIGQFKIKGFVVRKTKFNDNNKRFWLSPPIIYSGQRSIKTFWTENKKDWILLEKRALEQFDQEQTNELIKEVNKTIKTKTEVGWEPI